jgi:hypothetical protein
MRSTLASTRGTVPARATKQQAVAAAPAAAPAAKPVSAIETKKTTQFAARLFSAAAAAMIAVTGPAFADLNSLEAAAGGGKKEIGMEGGNEGREMSKLEEFFFSLSLSRPQTSTSSFLFFFFPTTLASSSTTEFGIGSAQQFGDATINGKDFSKQDLRRSNFTSAECR